jgi:hypothetical protein
VIVSEPLAVGSAQYDFETAVLHELGHALGSAATPSLFLTVF